MSEPDDRLLGTGCSVSTGPTQSEGTAELLRELVKWPGFTNEAKALLLGLADRLDRSTHSVSTERLFAWLEHEITSGRSKSESLTRLAIDVHQGRLT